MPLQLGDDRKTGVEALGEDPQRFEVVTVSGSPSVGVTSDVIGITSCYTKL